MVLILRRVSKRLPTLAVSPLRGRQVAEGLGVRHVPAGSVRRAGDDVRIDAQHQTQFHQAPEQRICRDFVVVIFKFMVSVFRSMRTST